MIYVHNERKFSLGWRHGESYNLRMYENALRYEVVKSQNRLKIVNYE